MSAPINYLSVLVSDPEGLTPPRGPMKARIKITLKNGVLDPQGKAIERALAGLDFAGVGEVRVGKVMIVEVAESDAARAKALGEEMARKLLANTVIESFTVEVM